MNAKFISKADITRDQLDWGELGWISPAHTGSTRVAHVLVSLEPGHGHDFHRHPHQEEILYVLSGEVEQWLEHQKRTLQPGDAVFIGQGVVHASFNSSATTTTFLVVLSPCAGEAGYEAEEVASDAPWCDLRKPSKRLS